MRQRYKSSAADGSTPYRKLVFGGYMGIQSTATDLSLVTEKEIKPFFTCPSDSKWVFSDVSYPFIYLQPGASQIASNFDSDKTCANWRLDGTCNPDNPFFFDWAVYSGNTRINHPNAVNIICLGGHVRSQTALKATDDVWTYVTKTLWELDKR